MDFYKLNINLPTSCPTCGSTLEISENLAHIVCTNPMCQGKLTGNIMRWIRTLKLDGLGESLVEDLIEKFDVKKVSDLYKVDLKKLKSIDGYGELKIEKFNKELRKKVEMSLPKFIEALNITGISEKKAEKLLSGKTLQDISSMKVEDFLHEGIGLKTAQSFFNQWKEISDEAFLLSQYVTIGEKMEEKPVDGVLSGKTICFTGKSDFPRSKMQQMAKNVGAIIHDSVKKDTNILVCADGNTTSSKAVKAQKLGTEIMSQEAFFSIIGTN